MEEKSSSDQPKNENLGQESDNTENNEVLSEAAAATEISISTDKAAVDEKPEPSPIKSESTSGLEMVSRSTTSDSEIPCERGTSDAEKKPEPSPLVSEPTSGLEMVSRSTTDSEIPCEVATSDAGKKPEPSPLLSEPTSGIELISRSSTTASEIPSEGVETSDKEKKPATLSPDPAPELEAKSVQSEGTNTVERNTDSRSTPPKKSFIGQVVSGVKHVLSPPKSGKSKANRSKSMSPSKSQSDGDNSKPVPEEACVASESEEYSKKENDTVYRKLKRKWSKFKLGSSKPSSESANLVSNEEIDRNEETSTSKLDNQPEQISSDLIVHECQWVDNSLSLTDRPTYDGTTMTDIPSICSAGDVFPSDSSKKSSEIGENTSEEAVAGSLVSSPDEVPDIKKDKDGECKMKDGSSNDQNVVEVESEKTTKNVPSIDKETRNIVVEEESKENQSILKNDPSTDSANVAENSKIIQPISKDDPSTVKEIDEIVAEDSNEKQSAEKDSENQNDKD